MKTFLMSALLLAGSAAVYAQQPAPKNDHGKHEAPRKTPEQRAIERAAKLEKELGLNAVQKTNVQNLLLNHTKQQKAIREKYKDRNDKSAGKAEHKAVHDAFVAGMKTALTADQFVKWEALKKAEQEEHQAKKKTPEQHAAARAAHLEKSLGLNATQKTKVESLLLERQKQMKTLHEKYNGKDKSAGKAEYKAVRDTFDAGMKATLTPEQYAKWKADQKKNMHKHKGAKGKHKPAGKGTGNPTKPDLRPDDADGK